MPYAAMPAILTVLFSWGWIPKKEQQVSFLGDAVAEGRFLKAEDPYGIVAGRAFLEKFETKIGRKLVLMSQDGDNEMASAAFRIVGVFEAEMEATEKQYVFITLNAAAKCLTSRMR